MIRIVFAAAAAVLAVCGLSPRATAQAFPAPGTGAFTWEPVGDRPLSIESLSFAPGGRLFGGRDSVFVFEPAPSGPPAGRWRTIWPRYPGVEAILALDAAGDTLLKGTPSYITRTTDGGQTWEYVNGCPPGGPAGQPPCPTGGPKEPDGFYAIPAGHPRAGRLLSGLGILYSDDRGATWTEATRSFPGEQGYAHSFTSFASGQVIMTGNWGTARSEDGGTSYVASPVWGDYRFLGSSVAAVATSSSVQSGTPSCGLADLALCDGAIMLGVDSMGPSVRAWRTNDGGRSWSEPALLPEPFDGVANGFIAGVVQVGRSAGGLGQAIAVLARGIVYATADGGQTWATVGRLPVFEPAHSARLVRLGPDGHLWVATGMSGGHREWVYRSAEPAAVAFAVAGEAAPSAARGVSVAVRPNPASGRVAVSVTLAAPSTVRVAVFDAQGREVAVAFDGALAAGEREVPVETGGWPAGVYVVRVTAAGGGGGAAGEASARFTVAQ